MPVTKIIMIISVAVMSLVIGTFWWKISLGYYQNNPINLQNDSLIQTTTATYNQIKNINK